MESVIKWRTGEPKDTGRYIITTTDGNIGACFYVKGKDILTDIAIAWCPLSEIEPYKE